MIAAAMSSGNDGVLDELARRPRRQLDQQFRLERPRIRLLAVGDDRDRLARVHQLVAQGQPVGGDVPGLHLDAVAVGHFGLELGRQGRVRHAVDGQPVGPVPVRGSRWRSGPSSAKGPASCPWPSP